MPGELGYLKNVLLSCKLTHTIFSYLEEQGQDLTVLYDQVPLASEFLRDPSYWIEANQVESFLSSLLRQANLNEENLLQKMAHSMVETRSLGVLDSVLRMMPRPMEIFNHPQRFLSYFISPEPPIENIRRSERQIAMDLPLSEDQYPLSTSFLKFCFEALPLFVGQPLAHVRWEGIHLQISWGHEQPSFLTEQDLGHSISPDLLQSVVESLQKHQRELEDKNGELQEKNNQLLKAHQNLEKTFQQSLGGQIALSPELDEVTLSQVRQNIARLNDYMVRAQQLVTMIASAEKTNPAVKAAMHRMDWDHIRSQFPVVVKETQGLIDDMQRKEIGHV